MAKPVGEHLYCTEEEIAEFVLGPGRLRDWRDRVKVLERQGLPQFDPLMGGRYRPAVRAFFDRLNGITNDVLPSKTDQPEKWKSCEPTSSVSPIAAPATRLGSNTRTGQGANVSRFGAHRRKPSDLASNPSPSRSPPTSPKSS
jgi:hypothetical protein